MESILPIALKLCARSPSILSDVSMQFVPMQNWTGLEWKALTLMDELCFTSQRHLPSHVCKIVQANGPMSGICTCLTCLQCASNDRKRLLEIISEMRRQSFGRWEQLQGFGILEDFIIVFLLVCTNSYGFWGLGHFRAWAKSESRNCKTSWIESFWGVQKNGCGYLGCFHMQLEPENGDAREPRTVWLSQGGMSQNIEATILLQQTASISLWCAACRFSMFPQCFTVLLFSLHELVVPLIK